MLITMLLAMKKGAYRPVFVTIAPDATMATISARIKASESIPAVTGLVPLIAWN